MVVTPTNRRIALRRMVRVPCQIVRERDFKLVGERALDLSAEGMLVPTDARVLTGESVIVSFRLPLTRVWIDAEAVVARVVHGRRRGDHGHCLGLQFLDVTEPSKVALRTSLRGLPPPLPRRPQPMQPPAH